MEIGHIFQDDVSIQFGWQTIQHEGDAETDRDEVQNHRLLEGFLNNLRNQAAGKTRREYSVVENRGDFPGQHNEILIYEVGQAHLISQRQRV